MSPYRHLIVCAIVFFVLFYGFANLVKAEPISTDCDYEHVAMLFGAKAYDYWRQPVDPYGTIPPNFNWTHILSPLTNSTYGLPYDSQYNLIVDNATRMFPFPMRSDIQVINMRDVAQAIQNYQKSKST